MPQEQLQNEIAIIKSMIGKTRREVAQSGYIFTIMGIYAIAYVLVITLLERFGFHGLILPAMIGMTVLMTITMIILIKRQEREEKVKSYLKSLYLLFLGSCSVPVIIMTFLFPLAGIYSFGLTPVFAALIFGTMLFFGGAIYEFKYLFWSGVIAWAGGCLMPFVHGHGTGIIMIVILLNGFVIPGILLTKKYKDGK